LMWRVMSLKVQERAVCLMWRVMSLQKDPPKTHSKDQAQADRSRLTSKEDVCPCPDDIVEMLSEPATRGNREHYYHQVGLGFLGCCGWV
jgi:hypothetical protein